MEQRKLGHFELAVSVLALGTVSLGLQYGIAQSKDGLPPPDESDSIDLIHKALASGINFIDTARAYGTSEQVVGKALKDRPAVVATKAVCLDKDGKPLRGDALRRQVRESLETSLRLLNRESVELFMAHSAPLELLQDGEIVPLLRELRDEGLVETIGASTYGNEAALLAIEEGIDALQVGYSLFDQRMADKVFPKAQEHGVGMIVRSVYLKGAVTERAEDLPAHLQPLIEASRSYRQQVKEMELNPAEAALRFVLTRSDVTSALVGVRSVDELEQALSAAAAGPLTNDQWAALAAYRIDDPALVDPSTWGIP
ncbi:MAG: aldo/keto reductase [Anaerolineae bacterium]|nr:aldo/keto reductase [Anaerolineae bacterium]